MSHSCLFCSSIFYFSFLIKHSIFFCLSNFPIHKPLRHSLKSFSASVDHILLFLFSFSHYFRHSLFCINLYIFLKFRSPPLCFSLSLCVFFLTSFLPSFLTCFLSSIQPICRLFSFLDIRFFLFCFVLFCFFVFWIFSFCFYLFCNYYFSCCYSH